jgi:hypothetical protein
VSIQARRKDRGVVRFHEGEGHVRQRDDPRRCGGCSDTPAVTDIGIGQPESGLLVVVLLRHHAVEPDDAVTCLFDRGIPDAQAIAAAAQVGSHDVEAKKRESVVVVDAGNRRGSRAVELSDQKATGVDGGKARGVAEAGIPALGRRPVGGDGDLVRRHRADAQVCLLVLGTA